MAPTSIVNKIDELILIGARTDIICNIERQASEFPPQPGLLPGKTGSSGENLNRVKKCAGGGKDISHCRFLPGMLR